VCCAQSVVCGFMNRSRPLPFREHSGQSIIKFTLKDDYFSVVNRIVETGRVSHREPDQGRPCVADATTENVRQTFVFRSPRKSTKRDSLELNVPKTTVWKILKKRLRCKPYRLQLV
jgi:hypothetical protein